MIFSKTVYASLLVSAVAILSSSPSAEAHSWAACVNWKFNNKNKEDWSDKGGKCLGYARRYPYRHAFYSLDSESPSRHYQQPKNGPACSDMKHGVDGDVGSDERRANPISNAYNGQYGPMTTTRVGNTLCVRWPAKNHAKDNEDDTVVLINLAKKSGKDPSQKSLDKSNVAKLRYKNCGKGKNSDRLPCGGCFPVPPRAPGIYLLQWRWMLNPGEWYTSCADIEIKK
ncbi:hypothetical protein BGZ70_007743 [Mortierella alpina]|uniref:Secreted protein n=1 Tax=Mortierella alpina TaxID=64518 RepID=A0A9P6J5J7_MORAP|nr:hypothetical protein BGZ70_007743 [Mortierella alpina]